jgi:hypothetical protein
MTPSGIEHATFRPVVQCLRHCVPLFRSYYGDKIKDYEIGHIRRKCEEYEKYTMFRQSEVQKPLGRRE